MRNKNWLALGTFGIYLAAGTQAASACGPFDFRVVDPSVGTSRGVSKGASSDAAQPAKITWAEGVLKNGTLVHSDVGFYSPDSWSYADPDSRLSRDNTLIEFYGYFDHLLSPKEAKDPANKSLVSSISKIKLDLLEASRRVAKGEGNPHLEGYNISDFKKLGTQNFSSDMDAATYLSHVLKDEKAAAELTQTMADRNSHPQSFGEIFFTRSSYLSAGGEQQYALSCMVLAYAQDIFTNEALQKDCGTDFSCASSQQNLMKAVMKGGEKALIGSITDYAAAVAFKDKTQKTFNVGGLDCELKPSNVKLEVVTTRCGGGTDVKFTQENPVVRGVGSRKIVQVGNEAFDAVCAGVNLSSSAPDVKPVLAAISKPGANKKLSNKTVDVLGTIEKLSAATQNMSANDITKFRTDLAALKTLKEKTLKQNEECHANLSKETQKANAAGGGANRAN